MKDSNGYNITPLELRNFCDGAITQIRDGIVSDPELWLLLRTGDTVTVPGDDYTNYAGEDEFPILLMTGPDPEWLLQWFMDDSSVGGDEWVASREQAIAKVQAATEDDLLAACQRAIDEQFSAFLPYNPQ